MARRAVQIPIDDFVVGAVPMRCVVSGEPASGLVEFENDQRVFRGWWLLLLFLGPIGVLAIVGLFALSPRVTPVRGALPMTRTALDSQNHTTRRVWWGYGIGFVATVAAVVVMAMVERSFGPVGATLLIGLVALVVVWLLALPLVDTIANRINAVDVVAMAGGRWVEVRGVHPAFASAVEQQRRDDRQARSGLERS